MRSQVKEWMDTGHYSKEEYEESLSQLGRIGRFLGGDRATFWAFDQLKRAPTSILDVGCGGGLFTQALAERYPEAKVVGIDISSEAIEIAKQKRRSNLTFAVCELDQVNERFDVVTSTLVCHHLTDAEIVLFLKKSYQVARQSIIFNDLHRHPLARVGYSIAARLLWLNRMVIHDGLISIDRGFLREEWIHYCHAANIPLDQVTIHWKWAFRWLFRVNHE